MYKKNRKEEFIKEYMTVRVVAKTSLYSLFKKVNFYENQYKKDCSKFSVEEILQMYEGFKARSKFTVLNYNVILKAYCAWVNYQDGNDDDNPYNNITADMIAPLIPKDANKLLSRDEVDDIEDQLYNYSDKAIVELLFIGVAGKNMEDIYSVSAECVQGDALIVNGKEFPMTCELKNLLPKAFAETEIMSYGDTMRVIQVNGKGRIYKERSNARGVDSEDTRFRYFYRKIQLFRQHLDIPGLTMKNIAASGLWHYLQLGMEATGLDLRGYLRTEQGKNLAIRYGFSKDYYLDHVCAKYEHYME